MSVPVVFLSKTIGTPCSYIKFSTSMASKFNDNVYLIGDDGNERYANCKFESLSKYDSSHAAFDDAYVHMSTLHPGIEKFCFSRWFILRDFMIEHGYDKVLHLDTDILFFSNATTEFNRFNHLECALSGRTSGHSSYWTLEGLSNFCDYVLYVYSNCKSFEFHRLASVREVRKKFGLDGGVCDMTLLEHYARYKAPHLVGEVSIMSDGPYYDHIICASEGFSCKEGKKDVQYQNGKPFCIHEKSGKKVWFATLHFQGANNKSLMKKHYDLSF